MNFFQILLYMLLAYMIINMFQQSRRAGKENDLVSLIRMVDEKDEFFARVNELIEGAQDEGMKNKFKVLRLWGDCCHKMFDVFEKDLADIDCDLLLKDWPSGQNEDSFFYLYITIPFLLHQDGRDDLRSVIRSKMNGYEDQAKDQMIVTLAKGCDKFFLKEEDRGASIFRMIWEGEYEGMKYNKQLVSVYKSICASCLAWLARENGNTEEFNELVSYLGNFAGSGIGSRWLRALDLYKVVVPQEGNEEIVDTITEVVEEEEDDGEAK